jgi:hypothetical protein
MVGKLGLVGLIAVGLVGQVQAQQSNTVFATIVTGRITNGNFVVPAQYMIGQSGHQVFATVGDAPSHTCVVASAALTIQVQGSYDNNSWTNISAAISGNTGTVLASGQGIYPFVRLAASIFPNGGTCAYALYYGGIVSNVAAAPVITSSSTFRNGTVRYNNFVGSSERGNRYGVASAVSTTGAAATLTIGAVAATDAIVVDCISVTVVATGTVATGASDIVTATGASNVYSMILGLPTNATVGTVVSRDICGLNLYLNVNSTQIAFASGIANASEQISATYYLVSQ